MGVVTLTHQPKTLACDNWNCDDIFYVNVRFNPIMFLQQALTFYLYKFYVIFFSTVILVYHLENQIG